MNDDSIGSEDSDGESLQDHGLLVLGGFTSLSCSCKLCCIATWFPECYLNNSVNDKFALRVVQSSASFSAYREFEDDWPILARFYPITVLRLWNQSRNRMAGADLVSIPRRIGSMRSLKSDSIDFAIVQNWLHFCRDNHTTNCSNFGRMDRIDTKLIDCQTRKLVDSKDLPYLTLSYMWDPKEKMQEHSNELPDQLPNTIKDAITATLKLGFRYIWIDRYW